MVMALSDHGRRLHCSRKYARRLLWKRAAGAMLLENDVATRLLLVMTQVSIVEMMAVDVNIVDAPVVVLLACSLLSIRATAAGPVTESYVTHRHKHGTSFRTGEESMSFVGAVACSLTCR